MKPRLLLLTFLLLAAPAFLSAAGIEVSPARLTWPEAGGESAERELLVRNPTSDVQVFEVYADNFPEFIVIEPKSFSLEAAQSRSISLKFKVPQNLESKLTGNLSVVARPLAVSEFRASSGVKIPFTFEPGVAAKAGFPRRGWLVAAVVLYGSVAAFLLGLVIYHFRQKKKNQV